MRSEPDGQSMRMQSLNSGCEGHADLARDIEKQFIDWTEIAPWLALQIEMGTFLSLPANRECPRLSGLHLSWDRASPESRRSTRTACRSPWPHSPPPRNSALRTPRMNCSVGRTVRGEQGHAEFPVAVAAHVRHAGAAHQIAMIAGCNLVHGAAWLGLDVVRNLGDHVDRQAVESSRLHAPRSRSAPCRCSKTSWSWWRSRTTSPRPHPGSCCWRSPSAWRPHRRRRARPPGRSARSGSGAWLAAGSSPWPGSRSRMVIAVMALEGFHLRHLRLIERDESLRTNPRRRE